MKIETLDNGILRIPFVPSKYDTPEEAAKAFYESMKIVVEAYGQNPDSELHIADPEQSKKSGLGKCWYVSWEAGPYDWAVSASLQGLWGENWYTEPYYGFDLCFEVA